LCCSIACGQGLPAPAAAAIGAAPVSAESNACKPPEHGRISCKVVCDDGYSACGDHCTKLESDSANCGVCGKVCSAGQTCNGGICVGSCLPGQTSCGGACTDLSSDDRNCGACGNNCSLEHSSSACKKGQCDISSCHPGWANCDGNVNNGCETHLDDDRNNCGGCGVHCGEDEICSQGHPVRCGKNEHREGNRCAANQCGDTDSDRNNCGWCGNRCGDDEVCDHGHKAKCSHGKHRNQNRCEDDGGKGEDGHRGDD
jgi:hypothetical protein